jgi:hypothetical protein
MVDSKGEYIPGKSTLVICSNDNNILYFLSAIINSKFAEFYITQRYSSSSYNGGVSFTKDMINNLPIPKINVENKDDIFYTLIHLAKVLNKTNKTNYDLLFQLNSLVYQAYLLSEDEISVIEKHYDNEKSRKRFGYYNNTVN